MDESIVVFGREDDEKDCDDGLAMIDVCLYGYDDEKMRSAPLYS